MAGLPVVSGSRVVRALTRAGFVLDRIGGSHHVLVHPADPLRTVTVPVHAGRDLKPGTLRAGRQALPSKSSEICCSQPDADSSPPQSYAPTAACLRCVSASTLR